MSKALPTAVQSFADAVAAQTDGTITDRARRTYADAVRVGYEGHIGTWCELLWQAAKGTPLLTAADAWTPRLL